MLIVEDNIRLLESISGALKAEQYLCEGTTSFLEAYDKICIYDYDIAVIDINLPDGSGLELIRELKKRGKSTGIIVVSARNSTSNKIEGLVLGADDYLTKPFDMAELIARVKALLRRNIFGGSDTISSGAITILTDSREVFIMNKPVILTRSEYDILLFFLANPNRVLTKESIAEHIWGDNMDLADSFDFIYSHIKNLRKKITSAGAGDPIKALYGIGYKLKSEEQA